MFISSVLRCFPAFSHAFALASSAYHSYIFTIFSSIVRCFPAFSHVFAFISSAYHHISITFPAFSQYFHCITLLFISCVLRYFPAFSHIITLISSTYYQHISYIFTVFSMISVNYIILRYSGTKMADLGGIDAPPSTNCLVAHTPAKCSM